jgi:class 3 adenylate cyclase
MTGDAVNFIFRMEKLASAHGVSFCVSAAAEPLLAATLPLEVLPAEYELKGFPGMHRFFRLK